MNVPPLGAIEAVKEEPVRSRNVSDARHVEIRTNGLIVAKPEPSSANVPNEPRAAASSHETVGASAPFGGYAAAPASNVTRATSATCLRPSQSAVDFIDIVISSVLIQAP